MSGKANNGKAQKICVLVGFIVLILIVLYIILLPAEKFTPLIPSSINQTSSKSHYWLDSEVTILDTEDTLNYNQKDSRLINYIKARHLTPPSKLPYNFTGKYSQSAGEDGEITGAVRTIFKTGTSGFFVECGGFDGIYSNTLFLEREYGWSGLLIECNPVMVAELRKTHRKAFVADVCVSVTENPAMINITSMDAWPASSSVGKGDVFPKNKPSTFTRFEVSAFPLYSVIAATGVTVVDFITLDVQSVEWEVIKNFPFQVIFVKVWIIEVVLLNAEDKERMKSLMQQNGYRDCLELSYDYLFVHKSVPLDNDTNKTK